MRKKTFDTKTIHSSKSKALQSPCTGAAFMQSQSSTTYQKKLQKLHASFTIQKILSYSYY